MLKWCAYCQQFQEEVPPFENLLVTHGICEKCATTLGRSLQVDDLKLQSIVRLQQDIYKAGNAGDPSKIDSLIREARTLGIRPVDVVLGFVCPMLTRIGALWETGELSIREEHRFTSFAEKFLEVVQSEINTAPVAPLLLVPANQNFHTLGLKVVQMWLAAEGIGCQVMTPGLPAEEILKLASENNYPHLGISLSDRSQLPTVTACLEDSHYASASASRIFVGGFAIKSKQVLPTEVEPAVLLPDFRDLKKHLQVAASIS